MQRRDLLTSIPALAVLFYLALLFTLLLCSLHKTNGTFVYPLDDPYIHLAMAEQLAHGHYGINAVEASSPSSSILWPVLLVPFASHTWNVYLPLLWNILFGTLAAWAIGKLIARTADRAGRRVPLWQQIILIIQLVLLANLASLTLIGMEHVLQVLLSILCAAGLIAVYDGEPMPTWAFAAAVIAPMVRYENLSLSFAIAIGLVGLRQWKKAFLVAALSIAPLLAFGLFLKSLGLPALPTSVLVKGKATNASPLLTIFKNIHENLLQDMHHIERGTLVILLVCLLFLALRERSRTKLFVLGGGVFVAIMQLLIGRFGWFHRYEVYALIFVALLLIRLLADLPSFAFYLAVPLLLLCDRPFINGTLLTPRGSYEVYQQQYQMHRFIQHFHHGDFAVHDLGLVSYHRPADEYVLDIYGLASPEASRQTDKNADWLEGIVRRHHIPLVMMYPNWFQAPASWAPLAQICLDKSHLVVSESCVVFYSSSSATLDRSRDEVNRFLPTLPPEVLRASYPATFQGIPTPLQP